jgi:transposase-like protein
LERFNERKRAITGRWHVDETYIKVRLHHTAGLLLCWSAR